MSTGRGSLSCPTGNVRLVHPRAEVTSPSSGLPRLPAFRSLPRLPPTAPSRAPCLDPARRGPPGVPALTGRTAPAGAPCGSARGAGTRPWTPAASASPRSGPASAPLWTARPGGETEAQGPGDVTRRLPRLRSQAWKLPGLPSGAGRAAQAAGAFLQVRG